MNKNKMLNLKFFLIIIPILFGSLSSFLCNMKNSGSNVKFRPPPYVFGIVWTILYICMGIAWYKAIDYPNQLLINIIYSLIVFLLFIWVYFYSCKNKKKEASWLLILVMTFVLISLMISPVVSKMLMCPLLAWCIFATIMNTTEIQSSK